MARIREEKRGWVDFYKRSGWGNLEITDNQKLLLEVDQGGFGRSLYRLDEVGDVQRHLVNLGVAGKVSIVLISFQDGATY